MVHVRGEEEYGKMISRSTVMHLARSSLLALYDIIMYLRLKGMTETTREVK